ncbi:MFS transporter [Aeromicrobium sp. JJY06]|uniref:MFS transporter n=1 Tax=Aeromicrobium sp. JJY06 TaxID=3373478 RepID=UPI00376EF407
MTAARDAEDRARNAARRRGRRGRRRAGSRPERLPATFWWLWFSHFLYWAARFTMIFLSLFLTVEMGLSPSSMGIHLAVFGLGGVLSVLAGGAVADAVGRRPALLGSLGCSAVLTALLAVARPGPGLLVVLFGLGLASFAAKPVFETFIADVVDASQRHRAYSLNFVAINSGFIVAPQVAALLIELSYAAMLAVEAVALLVVCLLVAVSVPSDRRPRAQTPGTLPGRGLGPVFADRTFMAFVALNLVFMVVLMQNTLSLPIFMAKEGYSTSQFAWLLTLNGVILILFQMPVSTRVLQYRASTTLVVASALMALGYAIYPFADAWWILAVGVTVWTAGELINMPTAAWITSRFATVRFRGRYLGVFGLTSALAFLVGPLLSGILLEWAGPQALWWACAGLMAASAVARWLLVPFQEERIRHHR